MAIRIITDSVADIPLAMAQKYDIIVLPLTVNFETVSYRDGIDLTQIEFFTHLKQAQKLPTTSQVPPGVFHEVFEKLINSGDQIIGVFMSGKLSGTFQSAQIAKEMLGRGDITLLDSQMISFGTGQVVVTLAQLAKQGLPYNSLVQKTRWMIEKSTCLFIVDTLDYLTKGGRLKPAEAIIGNLLNIKPILTMIDGELKSCGKARGRKKAIKTVLTKLQDANINLNDKVVSLYHAVDFDYLMEFKEQVLSCYPEVEITFSEVGSVVGTHSGPGCIAISYIDIPKSTLFSL